jgi:diguanylate cyclase (GGDEF)-like protein/PAS domain S-box-containing protein
MALYRPDGSPLPLDETPAHRLLLHRRPMRDELLALHVPGTPPEARQWLRVSGDVLPGQEVGKPPCGLVYFRDVTAMIETAQKAERVGHELQRMLDALDVLVLELSLDGVFLRAPQRNPKGHVRPLIPEADFVGRSYRQVLPGHLHAPVSAALDAVLEGGDSEPFDYWLDGPDGERRWYRCRLQRLAAAPGLTARALAVIEDINEQRLGTEALRRSAVVFGSTTEAVVVADARRRILDVNPAFCRITGHTLEQVKGLPFESLFDRLDQQRSPATMLARLQEQGRWRGEGEGVRTDGSRFPLWASCSAVRNDRGLVHQHVVVFSDISPLKDAQAAVQHQALHDALTGLPNRAHLLQQLEDRLHRARKEREPCAVLFLDLDHFKVVNDSLGHSVGDSLLVALARRLREHCEPDDLLARLGGDEFVIVLAGVGDDASARARADAFLRVLDRPFDLGEHGDIYVGASIGISLCPRDGNRAEALLRNADTALYAAKGAGRGFAHPYQPSLTVRASEQFALGRELRVALQSGQLTLAYQPILETATGLIRGVEALVRWQHPERGMLTPDHFIPIAEETGLIRPLGRWVLHQALHDFAGWARAGVAPCGVSINVSARQLISDAFVDDIQHALETHGVAPAQLQIELTESTVFADEGRFLPLVHRLRALGVRIAIDDFGTGYSSLAYLRQLPVERLKIDRSFVRTLTETEADRAIVLAIVQVGQTLGMEIIAEGVETEAQRSLLEAMGCDLWQGFLCAGGRDLPGLLPLLAQGRWPAPAAV